MCVEKIKRRVVVYNSYFLSTEIIYASNNLNLKKHQLIQDIRFTFFFKLRNTTIEKKYVFTQVSPFYSISLTPLQVGTVTWHLVRAGRRGAPLLAAGQAAGRSQAAARRRPGSCSAGAGPTGGTNAFDLARGFLQPGRRRPGPPPAPALRARSFRFRLGRGARSGRGRGRGGIWSAAEPRRLSGRRALCWPPGDSAGQLGAALPACGAGQV